MGATAMKHAISIDYTAFYLSDLKSVYIFLALETCSRWCVFAYNIVY